LCRHLKKEALKDLFFIAEALPTIGTVGQCDETHYRRLAARK
jgi:hypothetical protein